MKHRILTGLLVAMMLAPVTSFAAKAPAAKEGTAAQKCIDVDTASAKELTNLKGVGEELAGRIIDYRKREKTKATKDGRKPWSFRNWQTLMKVSGIGPKICQDNINVVCFSGKVQKACPATK